VNEFQPVDPTTLTEGDAIRATRGAVLIHAQVVHVSIHRTSITIDLIADGLVLYLDEGWAFEVRRADSNAGIVAHANETLTLVEAITGHEHRATTPDRTIRTTAARCVECGELLVLSKRLNDAGYLRWATWDEFMAESGEPAA